MTEDETFLRRAIALSAEAAGRPGCEPFGAVIVKDGAIIGQGFNRSAERHDPTSHGETEAIRDACARLATTSLGGSTLYSSCEPCPLCVAAIRIANIERVVFAASLAQSDATLGRAPSIIAGLRAAAAQPFGTSEEALAAEAIAVLEAWKTR